MKLKKTRNQPAQPWKVQDKSQTRKYLAFTLGKESLQIILFDFKDWTVNFYIPDFKHLIQKHIASP